MIKQQSRVTRIKQFNQGEAAPYLLQLLGLDLAYDYNSNPALMNWRPELELTDGELAILELNHQALEQYGISKVRNEVCADPFLFDQLADVV